MEVLQEYSHLVGLIMVVLMGKPIIIGEETIIEGARDIGGGSQSVGFGGINGGTTI